MTDKTFSVSQSPAGDQSDQSLPSVTPDVQIKAPPRGVTKIWARKAGFYGRNPVPSD